MKKIKFFVISLIILFIVFLFSFGIEIGNFRIGKFNDFKNTHNKNIDKSSFMDYYNSEKILIINLWATWCGPCKAEIPTLNNLKSNHSKNPNALFLSLSIDTDSTKLNKFLKSGKFKFKDITLENINYRDTILALINNKKMSLIKTQSIPKTIIIKNQKILKKYLGVLSRSDINEIDSIIKNN